MVNETILILKIIVLIVLAFYGIFSFIMLNQVRVMNNILTQSSSTLLMLLAVIHVILAVSLFLFALAIL